jgi:hypothetical protein
VREVEPDHGPTLNNLAIILWRQNQQIPAMNLYLQAMQVMPMNKEILNNVAEALNALTEDQRKGQVPQRVYKTWAEQDVQLQQQMMPLGWYRWGATWVDRATRDKVEAAEKEAKDKIAKLEADFTEAQAKVDTINLQIRQNRDAMREMERQRVMQDFSGRQFIVPLPPQYYEYDRANRRLEVQREETANLIEGLRAKAQVIKNQLPVPKYTGVQLAVGVEGTPAMTPASPGPGAANLANEVGGGGAAAEKAEPEKAEPEKGEPAVPQPQPEAPTKPAGERPLKY